MNIFVLYLMTIWISRVYIVGEYDNEEWWTEKNFKGSGCGLIDYYPIILLYDLRNNANTSVYIAGVPAEIRTEHLPNTSLERYLYIINYNLILRLLLRMLTESMNFFPFRVLLLSKFGAISIEKALKNVSRSFNITIFVFKGTSECLIHLRLLHYTHSLLLLVFKQILFKLKLPENVIHLPDVTSST
jgi:hypothetical protein